MLLALAAAFVAAPIASAAQPSCRPGLPAQADGTSSRHPGRHHGGRFGASALIFWTTRWLVIEGRQFSVNVGSLYMLFVGLVCGSVRRPPAATRRSTLNKRAAGGHALASRLDAARRAGGDGGAAHARDVPFMFLTAVTAFFLSVYNGPSAGRRRRARAAAVFGDAGSLLPLRHPRARELAGPQIVGGSPSTPRSPSRC